MKPAKRDHIEGVLIWLLIIAAIACWPLTLAILAVWLLIKIFGIWL